MNTGKNFAIVDLALKGVALGMAIAALVLNILGAAPAETRLSLLTFGLFSLALSAISKEGQDES